MSVAWPRELPTVSRETLEALTDFGELVRKWNESINLIARGTLPDLWNRHVLDSAQLFLYGPERGRWLDMGSGAGFPALVIAILARELQPALHVICVEADLRKAAFLRTAINTLGIDADVIVSRVEDLAPARASAISARALASLPRLLALAAPHCVESSALLFPKGRGAGKEIEEARKAWRFKLERFPSITEPSGSLLKIGDLNRV